ncbi:uncharacterized protein LOC103943804 isoform X1 [Pyrus x bretschneideri]|nr:uncharacterized protein LOC103943804 isoform X1 [Pyrus x bretschneideri]
MDQPLVIEPLQAIQPKEHSMPLSKPPEDDGNGKMSELLQVLQESMRESESTTDSRVKSDEPSQTALGDEESDHSRKPSEA